MVKIFIESQTQDVQYLVHSVKLDDNVIHMNVKLGSKITNLVNYACNKFEVIRNFSTKWSSRVKKFSVFNHISNINLLLISKTVNTRVNYKDTWLEARNPRDQLHGSFWNSFSLFEKFKILSPFKTWYHI